MNERDKDIYESGVFCGTLDERQRIIKLLENEAKGFNFDRNFYAEAITNELITKIMEDNK